MADSLHDPLLARPASSAAASGAAASTTDAPSAGSAAGAGSTGSSSASGGTRERKVSQAQQISDTFQMVKDYARQETLDPLKSAGRWIAFGLAGAFCIGVATFFLALGLLRLIQTEWPGTFHGRWMSLLPYLCALGLCLLVGGLAFMRINKKPLDKETR